MTRALHHVVTAGETLRSIAAAYGVSPTEIWEHASNARLRRERSPEILAAGDRVWIPSAESPWIEYLGAPVPCRTGGRYVFAAAQLAEIRVHFEERDGSPMANWSYRLQVRGRTIEGQLSGEGLLTARLPLLSDHVTVELWPAESNPAAALRFNLAVGHLEPASVLDGVQQRLSNLGFYRGPIDGQDSDMLAAALARFRAFRRLPDDRPVQEAVDELQRKHRS